MNFEEILDRAIQIPGDRVGFELMLDTRGRNPEISKVISSYSKLMWTAAAIGEFINFYNWFTSENKWDHDQNALMAAFYDRLGELPNPEPDFADFYIDGHIARRKLYPFFITFNTLAKPKVIYSEHFDILFCGAYRENPTVTKIMVTGCAAALTMATIIWGTVQVMKEAGAAECRAQIQQISDKHISMLREQARLEGKWTGDLRESHMQLVKAALLTSATCGSMLGDIGIRAFGPSGPGFEVSVQSKYPPQ